MSIRTVEHDALRFALPLLLMSGFANACIETDGAPRDAVSFLASNRAIRASDYDDPAGDAVSEPDVPEPADGPAAGAAAVGTGGAGGGTAAVGGAGGGGAAAPPPLGGATGTVDVPPVVEEVPSGPAEGTLTVALTSDDLRGRYSPRNCGAVWIETKEGEFVKTIERWCGFRAYYLERWTEASGGWGSRFSFFQPSEPSADEMDAEVG